ncbi:TetR/AcrR family transcriptional regulator [Thalassotalea ganghwensis]
MLDTKERVKVKRRTKGEQTRNNILMATIEVLAQNGIKGTTHRAIASHADIQLSLTTYYFKDIQELVHQAFKLNSEQTMVVANFAWHQAFDYIDALGKTKLKKVSIKQQVREQLAQLATEYIINKVSERPQMLAVEQLLFTQIQTTPELRELAKLHRNALLAPFIKLCRYFDKDNAELDAEIMLTVFTQLEYNSIIVPVEELDRSAIYNKVNRVIGWMMKLK